MAWHTDNPSERAKRGTYIEYDGGEVHTLTTPPDLQDIIKQHDRNYEPFAEFNVFNGKTVNIRIASIVAWSPFWYEET